MRRNSKWWIALSVVVVVAAIALGLTLGSSNGTGSPTTTSPSTSNTITFAEGAGAAPNYIFPYMAVQYFSVDNTEQFQEMTVSTALLVRARRLGGVRAQPLAG